ncbi:ftsk/SpoIIIE family protein, putative [Mycobacteroides abscessus subsp. massiliense]|uniref:ATP-binding protein n=1 Tax=Mycobacteroides abscessus TaxID=36809 RepID=UPI0009A55D76|nr:AAA family ATPase [Mycobacteroides abscessus]SLG53734.1 ftsk/SpoIIIE family protein, putative [Mycobacteroides abscessus subsp. massiliense]SLH95418.1 ftsk/SpoIIIE family protein, putative [Mycobacteroides abscessus subsp. massiliense]
MITNTDTLSVPVGVTPDGELLNVDLRRDHAVLITGTAGSGKTVLLHRMRHALERQLDATHLFHDGGIRPNTSEVILAARAELQRRLREPNRIADGPAVLLVDDFGVLCIHRDATDELLNAVREIAVMGRPADVHLVLATQGTEGLQGALLAQMSTRIVLGHLVSPISRIFSNRDRELITSTGIAPTDRGDGVLVDIDGQPNPFTALPRESRAFQNAN